MACRRHRTQVTADWTLEHSMSFWFSMCKLAKLSFVAGAELPKRYLIM